MEAAVRALVDEANRAGGRDNVTALAFRLEDAAAPAGVAPEGATLVGPTAEAEGLTATEVRRRAAAAAAEERREQLAAKPRPPPPADRGQGARPPSSCRALAFGAWYGNRQVWFLGTDDGGRVAIYRGLPYELPFGVNLYEERYASPIQTGSLSEQAPGRGHRARPALPLGRDSPGRRNRREPGDREVISARNRELGALVPVALLLTAGFAAVFAQENARPRTTSA